LFAIYVSSADSTKPSAPTVDLDAASDSGTANDDDITNVKEPKFTGEAEEGSTVEVFDGTTSLGTATANVDDPNAASGNKGWSLDVPSDKALTDGTHPITAKATDPASNASDPSSELGVKVDTKDPVVTDSGPTTEPNANGWYNTDVENAFKAEDALSGLADPTQATINKTTSGQGQDLKVSSGSVSDVAGNTNPGLDSAAFDVDTTPPTLNPSVSPNPVLLKGTAQASAGAKDTLSGVESSNSNCDTPDTSSVGSKSVSCKATDNAGNTHTASASYSVNYDFKGFYQPVDNKDANGNYIYNSVKAGSAIPVKFSLAGNQGLSIFQSGYPASKQVTCPSGAAVDTIEELATTTTSGLKYDATANQYNYTWKTEGAWAGTCRQLTVKLADGTTHQASFKFTK
jgi:hypothetical protein